jgi:peptidoglycan hydrolase CwlO-like protein
MSILTAVLGAGLVVAIAALALVSLRTAKLRTKYSVITDAEAEARRIREESSRHADKIKADAARELEQLQSQVRTQRDQLATLAVDTAKTKSTLDQYRGEVALLEENLEDISFGVYKPHFGYDTPEDYKSALQEVVDKQKLMIREGNAARFAVSWTVGGSRREGERMQRQYTKLLLRAFNGECEAAIAKVAWNNATKMQERIRKSFAAINDLGQVMQVSVSESYMDLKLAELRLDHELEQKKHDIMEEQRAAREKIREQEKALREAEAELEKAAQDEDKFSKAIEKARVEVAKASGEEHARLTSRILQLEDELAKAQNRKERARALAELTTAGYVYVLSNIGSFGDNVLKIGMTRRLEPGDRVKELSDASVPFGYDVHAMVYSEDAPTLEKAFHGRFADRALNPVNPRKEFFRVSIAELESFVAENGLKIAFTHVPEAREYREALARRAAASQTPSLGEPAPSDVAR